MRVNEGAGSDSMGVCEGMNRDLGLGSMSLENPCELREKNSSPFSSNRTMFETEEVCPLPLAGWLAGCLSVFHSYT